MKKYDSQWCPIYNIPQKILLAFLFFSCSIFAYPSETAKKVELKVAISPEGGFMNGGYGSYKFTVINNTKKVIVADYATGVWHAGGQQYGEWKNNLHLTVNPGEEQTNSFIGWMPPQTEDLAKRQTPEVKGSVYIKQGKKVTELAYSVAVPVAKLPTALKVMEGNFVNLDLQEQTWNDVKHPEKVVGYLDMVYLCMQNLTANSPFKGEKMILKECPENPYFAYAGNPIVLNTGFVPKSVERFDNNEIDFGWVHEMGHNFDDEIGEWYNDGTFTEFQANIKLSYVVEQLCTENSNLRIKSWIDKESMLTGEKFNDEYFAPYGSKYLTSDRSWEELISDEYHSLFLSVIREKGWKVMEDYYRVFGDLARSGKKFPQGQDRVELSLAVFNHVAQNSLIPLYQKWRIPFTQQQLDSLLQKYGVI